MVSSYDTLIPSCVYCEIITTDLINICDCVCVCVHRKLGIWNNMLKLGVKGSQTVSPKTVPSKSLAFRLCMSKSKADEMGTFLAIQRLRLCSYVGGTSLTPDQGSQILQAAKYSREIRNK